MDANSAFKILKLCRSASISDIEISYKSLQWKFLNNYEKIEELERAKDIAINEVYKYDRVFIPWNKFAPWKKQKLISIWLAAPITNILKIISLINIYGLIFKKRKHHKRKSIWDQFCPVRQG
jgi:hypothetical protein